jgi:Tol biopolymer transport system component
MILFDGRNGDSLQVVSAGGGVPGPATTLDRANGENTHGWPFFLPDGKRFVFLAIRNDGSNEIRLGELGSMATKLLTQGESRVEYIAPGYLTYERNGILLAQAFDAGRGELTGDPFPLAEGVGTGQIGLAHFSGSNDGTLLYTGGGSPDRGLQWFDREGRPEGLVVEPKLLSNPTLSPDGTRVALEIEDEQGSPDLWIVDLGRRLLSRFTFDPGADTGPAWSPDGSRIAFRSAREPTGLYVKSASGTGNAEAILETASFTSLSGWTRDGSTFIANQIREGTSWDVLSIPLEGDEGPRALLDSRFIEGWPALSPDERILAYVSYESGTPEVYLTTYPALDGKWQVSQGGGVQPRWRRSGGELYYLALDRRMMAVDVRTASSPDIGVPRALFQAPVPRDLNERNLYDVTPDGQRFLLVTTSEANRVPPLTVVLHWEADLSKR